MKMFEKTGTATELCQLRKKSLRLESLEERTLLAVYAGLLPAPTGDTASTVVTTLTDVVDDSDGVVSLREAIENAKTLKTDITFDIAGTINLALGQLEITDEAVIIGDGITINAGAASRVFYITGNATLNGLTITGGAVAEGNGGGIQVSGGSLMMTDCVVTGNTARTSGALDLYNGSVTVLNSVFSNNMATQDGGVFQNYLGTFNAVNTLFVNNSARDGGAIVNFEATTTLSNCTATANTASRSGGAIWHETWSGGTLTVNNSIILNNTAQESGNDICQTRGQVTLNNSLRNSAACSGSIIANSCLEYTEGMNVFTDAANGDYSLPDDSVAVNAGNNKYVTAETDLAGNSRIVAGTVDIGAYENQNDTPYIPTEEPSSVVTTVSDIVDPYDGFISLREAISYAGGEETVTFSDTLYAYNAETEEWAVTDSRTILLQNGEIAITGTTVITTDGASPITIDGGGASRVFYITGNARLTGLAITGGAAGEENGGGFRVDGGSLRLTNCVVTGNTAKTSGALDLYNGSVTAVNSVFSDNTATQDGGVFQNYLGTFNAVNTLIVNNSARDGGAIVNYEATTTLTNCTVTANTASRSGGAVWNWGNLTINNSIVLENSAQENGNDICQASDQVTLNNSLWNSTACSGTINANTCIEYSEGDPLFVDAENGDYSLAEGSAAINAGNNDYVRTATDLAGNDRIVAVFVDCGAYEFLSQQEVETPSAVVTTIDDVVDPFDGYISLREAISYAQADQTITFSDVLYTFDAGSGKWNTTSSRTILLRSGSLGITGTTQISASSRNRITIDAGGASRVFSIAGNAALTGLVITGGVVADGNGGGIQVYGGSLTMTDCVVTGNTAKTSGGLDLYNGSVTVVNSVFSNNTTTWDGGAVQNYNATLNAVNTLFVNNSARDGGAIVNWDASMTLTNCTVAGNTGTGSGGGVYIGGGGNVNLNNTIVVKNDASSGQDIQADSAVTLNHSVYQTARCIGEITANDCVTYTSKKILFTNADAGDYTLASGSIAIDAGNLGFVAYGSDVAGNDRLQGVTVDIGAYEADGAKWNINRTVNESAKTIVYTVDSLNDGIVNDGQTTLREAVLYANGDSAADYAISILFDAALSGGTISLTGGELSVLNSYAVDAGNLAGGITIDAGGTSRIFYITGNAALNSLTITGGAVAEGNGGGIQVSGGSLTMTDCTVTGNTARTSGGLDIQNGSATIINSVFSNNTTTWDAGAIQNFGATLNAVNTLFVDNSGRDGGAIVNCYGSMTLTNCTVTANTAAQSGGGIWNYGDLFIDNTVIAGNSGAENGADICHAEYGQTVLNNSLWSSANCSGENHGD